MYASGHTLVSATFGFSASRRFGLPLVPVVVYCLAINHIDLDHVLNYRIDDGTTNSMIMHPLHVYGGVAIFAFCALAVAGRVAPAWALVLAGGYGLHLAADALAFAVSYKIVALEIINVAAYVLLIAVLRRTQPAAARAFAIFFLADWLVQDAQAGFIHFVLGIRPDESLVPILAANVLGAFWWIAFALFARRIGAAKAAATA